MDFVSLPQLQSCHPEHQEEVYKKIFHPDPFANEIKSSQLPQRSRKILLLCNLQEFVVYATMCSGEKKFS